MSETEPKRKNIRLPHWDYASEAWYYITICTHNHMHYFGEVKQGQMVLNDLGRMAQECWLRGPSVYGVSLDEFVIMPNHVHGILIYEDRDLKPIGSVVSGFKNCVARWASQHGIHTFAWQKRFYDHIIRNDASLAKIRDYIYYNPLRWELEKGNPENIGELW